MIAHAVRFGSRSDIDKRQPQFLSNERTQSNSSSGYTRNSIHLSKTIFDLF